MLTGECNCLRGLLIAHTELALQITVKLIQNKIGIGLH